MKAIFLLLLLSIAVTVQSQPTKLIVRAKAKDAKFIGSSIGGAQVIIRNARTGEIMAQGLTQGGTGNTNTLMKEPRIRYQQIADEKTAGFEAILDISDPVLLSIEVTSPINQPQAAVKVTTQTWLVPGKPIIGDGIVVEIPGFIVNVLSPQTHEALPASTKHISANVVMMCGCTISNDGLWDAKKIEVSAIIKKEGQLVNTIALKVMDKVNTFEGDYNFQQAGLYEITVYAYDSRTGNTGVGKVNVIVSE